LRIIEVDKDFFAPFHRVFSQGFNLSKGRQSHPVSETSECFCSPLGTVNAIKSGSSHFMVGVRLKSGFYG
jgi:hypothetical protein